MKKNYKQTLIFDLDGTIYEFENETLKNSGLYKAIIRNTQIYLSKQLKKTNQEAQQIFDSILKKYGNSISIGLEKEFKLDRYDYFSFAWNIEAKNFVRFNPNIKLLFLDLKNNFKMVLLSDAPVIWVNKVLEYLEIKDIFKGHIFSGEGDIRKEFGNAFKEITKKMYIKANECIVVGDQEETDIIPAKEIGMKTIYINKNESNIADYTINNIFKLKDVLKNYENF